MSKGSGFRQGMGIAFRLGTEMMVSIFLGSVMGYAVDHFFETKPWGLVVGVLMGGIAGMLNVYRAAQEIQFDNENDNEDDNDQDSMKNG